MSLKRGVFTFGGWTLVSRGVGFVRDLLTAMMLGAGPLADAFIVAQRLPNLFRSLFAEGALSAAFVPMFTKARAEGGDAGARRFAAEANAVLLAILLVFTGLMMAFMPWVIRIIAPGFSDDAQKFALTVSMAQIIFPYLLLISLTALQGGVLNALSRLGPFAAAPVLYNVIQIIALLGVVPYAEQMGTDAGHVLAWSITAAGVGQWVLLAWCCKRAGFPVAWQLPRLTPDVRLFLRRLGPGVLGAGASQINMAVSTVLASLLPTGAVAYLYYADRLNQLPLGVIGVAISMALLPLLARAVQENNPKSITHSFSRAIDIGLAFGLPAAVGLVLLSQPIFEVLFVRGAFTSADAAQTAVVLTGYALGIPAFILVKTFATRFFAGHDTRTPVRIALVAVASNVALSVWLLPVLGAFGIAVSASIAAWVNFALLCWRLRQQGPLPIDAECKRRLPRLLLAATLMGVVIYMLRQPLLPYLTGQPVPIEVVALAVLIGVGAVVYTGVLLATKTISAAEFKGAFKRDAALKDAVIDPDQAQG